MQKRLVSVGEFVKSQTPVMSVVRIDPLKVTAEISEQHGALDQGRASRSSCRSTRFPARRSPARSRASVPAVNTSTRAFPFEALVAEQRRALKPGTFARVHVETARVDHVLTIPYDAIQNRYGVNRAFVVDGEHLSARDVKLGERLGDRIEIVTGLKPSELVALTDVDRLTDGIKVTATRDAKNRTEPMLSELCVRRPVFATMLVMSLVVLGIFSFRDLGVDLFPKGRPGHGQRRCCSSPAPAPTKWRRPSSCRSRRRSAASPASTRCRRATSTKAARNITVKFVLERDINDAANDVREKVAAAMKSVPPQVLPPVVTEGGSRFRSRDDFRAVVRHR